jgi:hypothetical protein
VKHGGQALHCSPPSRCDVIASGQRRFAQTLGASKLKSTNDPKRMNNDTVKPYLEYLDKEMTIMGILSAFSVAVPALVIERIASAPNGTFLNLLWNSSRAQFWLSSGLMLLAASFFYIERASLAWHYGQTLISIAIPTYNSRNWKQWIKDADSWATWRPYDIAFTSMRSAFYGYIVAILNAPIKSVFGLSLPTLFLIALDIEGVLLTIRLIAKTRHKYEETPIKKLLDTLKS